MVQKHMTTMVKKMMNKEKQQQQLQTNRNHNISQRQICGLCIDDAVFNTGPPKQRLTSKRWSCCEIRAQN